MICIGGASFSLQHRLQPASSASMNEPKAQKAVCPKKSIRALILAGHGPAPNRKSTRGAGPCPANDFFSILVEEVAEKRILTVFEFFSNL
jgi:hypothetical protein